MQNHTETTGHTSFEESTEPVLPNAQFCKDHLRFSHSEIEIILLEKVFANIGYVDYGQVLPRLIPQAMQPAKQSRPQAHRYLQ